MLYLVVKKMDAEPGSGYLVAPFEDSDVRVAGQIQEASAGSGIYVAISSDVSNVYGEYANHEEVSLDELKSRLAEWGMKI